MPQAQPSSYFVHQLLRARDWQHRPQFDEVCKWWRDGGRGVLALVGMGGAGKTAIAERFLRVLPGGLPEDPDIAKDATLRTPNSVFVFSFYDAPNPEAFFEAIQMWLAGSPHVENAWSMQQLNYSLQNTSGLLVLDGLEKVQEDGVRGLFGRLTSPKLREFLDRISAGIVPGLGILVTSRFPLADLRDARPQFFRLLPIDEIELPAGVELLRAREVRGSDPQLASIVEACGQHALTVDFVGGYIAEFGGGDPTTPVDFKMDSSELRQKLDDEPEEARRHVLKQGHRFARLAERYRDAMLGNTSTGSEGDTAALSLLQRICLFRRGVDAEKLGNIFTGKKAVKVSGPALAALTRPDFQKKLDWLVRMRIVEASAATSSPKAENPKPKTLYTVHPAVRDGFLSGIGEVTLRENHEAVRRGLQVSLGNLPGRNPSDPATLDLLEEIVHHTLQSGHFPEAWDIYWNRIGNYQNLGWRLGAYERGERICRAFAVGASPESLVARTSLAPNSGRGTGDEGNLPVRAALDSDVPEGFRPSATTLSYQSLPEATQAVFINEWALYLKELGRLDAAVRCCELQIEMRMLQEKWKNASTGNLNVSDARLLSGRLPAGQATAAEALRLAELADDAEERFKSHVFRAHAHALRGVPPAALFDFRAALDWKHKAIGDNDRSLWSLVWHNHLLARLGRRNEATLLTAENINTLLEFRGPQHKDISLGNLILADLHRIAGDLAEAEALHASAHDWALARDAKELLCWSALVKANIEFSVFIDQCSEGPEAALPALARAQTAIHDGLKIARDCGFGIFHIDLLLARARLHLLSGEPHASLHDLRTALDDGVPANEQTGQPELLAATHTECGYAWAIAEGLQLRGEALLLQAALELQSAIIVDRTMIEVAETKLKTLWQVEQELAHAVKCRESHKYSHATIESMVLGRREMALNALREIPSAVARLVDATFQEMSGLLSRELNGQNVVHRHPEYRAKLGALQTSIDSVQDWKSLVTASRASIVERLIVQARNDLDTALACWQPLHDPEPERPDQNFQLDGKPYNYRAAETHRILADLASGVLTRYPIVANHKAQFIDQSEVTLQNRRDAKRESAMKKPTLAEIKGKVDFAIITIREDEFEAVLARFDERSPVVDGKQIYEYCRFKNYEGMEFGVAIVRTHSQGQNAAQSVTRDVIADLEPHWLVLAGIAGAPPDNDFSLGDVCLATRLNDFSVSAALEGKGPVFQQGGGDMHPDIQRLLAWLPAARERLGDWSGTNSLQCEKPKVIVPKGIASKSLYGTSATKRATRDSLARHFKEDGSSRQPKFHIGPGATANVLVKDTTLLQKWQESARHLTHVEMEAGGVYEAARHGTGKEVPLLCVRGISDVVGFKRSPEWTAFACNSAASFVHALLMYAPVNPQ